MERVEKIMDDSAEGIAYQEEISKVLAQNISNSDELEVLEELEALEKEEIEKKLPKMPDAPTKVPLQPIPKLTADKRGEENIKFEKQSVLA